MFWKSLVTGLENAHRSEGREQRPGNSSQRSVVRGQRSEISMTTGPREKKVQINSAKDLIVYKKAYDLAMQIFEVSRDFPIEERYALTSQIRRSSRSVCLNLREAWAKRRYEAHFINKLTDCDGENSETDSSLDFAKSCSYITPAQHKILTGLCEEIGKMLGSMMNKPDQFIIR